MNVTLRAGRPEDAVRCGVICYEAFKRISEYHNFRRDFPTPDIAIGLLSILLSRNDVYSVVAEVDGQTAGSNFLWKSEVVAGIGPITVDPDVQNSTVGRRLMEDVLHHGGTHRSVSESLGQRGYAS